MENTILEQSLKNMNKESVIYILKEIYKNVSLDYKKNLKN